MGTRSALEDPLKVFRYRITIGNSVYGFSECSGLESETEVIEYREGGDNDTPRKSAGLTKYTDITLKRGQRDTSQGANILADWYGDVMSMKRIGGNNASYRKEVLITQMNAQNKPAVTWVISQAFPKKYKAMSDLSGTGNTDSIEELTITHEGFERQGAAERAGNILEEIAGAI